MEGAPPVSNAKPRQRRRSVGEQMYWDQLTPRERVAFTLGYMVGQGIDFPRPSDLDRLRQALGDDRAVLCTQCSRPLPPPVPGAIGRPPKRCPRCRAGARPIGDD